MLVERDCRDDPELRALVALALGDPTPERLDALCRRYASDPDWTLFAASIDGRLAGCVGIERTADGRVVIRQIAVAEPARRRGVGRGMLALLRDAHGHRRLEAETDAEAAGFYARCGFAVTSLGERYPGVERFHCVLAAPEEPT